MLRRVESCKDYKAIVIDCNYQGVSKFEHNIRNDFIYPANIRLDNFDYKPPQK
jgi:(S)-2-hydroxy-acid oxidase